MKLAPALFLRSVVVLAIALGALMPATARASALDRPHHLRTLFEAQDVAQPRVTGDCAIQARLEAELADLRARAERYRLRHDDFMALQEDIVMARVERAILAIRRDELSGRAHVSFDSVVQMLYDRAADFLGTLEGPSMRVRLVDAIRNVEAAAEAHIDTAWAFHELFVTMVEARLEAALKRLQLNADAGLVSVRDFERVSEAMRAQAALLVSDVPFDC